REDEGNSWFDVKLREGRTQQIRKMFQAVGHPVSKLKRVAIGPISDPKLTPGQWRELSKQEVKLLATIMEPKREAKPKARRAAAKHVTSRAKPRATSVAKKKPAAKPKRRATTAAAPNAAARKPRNSRSAASNVPAVPAVRRVLVHLQQQLGRKNGGVLEGRDIGTKVFPETPHKFFLTARPEVRAERRFRELTAKGENADFETVLAETVK